MSAIHDSDKADCIVATTKCCGRVVLAIVNEPNVITPEHEKEILECIREGCSIRHWTAAQVREAEFRCRCKEVKSK